MRDIEDRRSFALIALAGALLASLSLKAALQLSGRFPFNADEAIVALMARHILEGNGSVFFYGQAYMGSLDAYLVAVAFAWLGQHVWAIRLVQALLYGGTILTTALLGKRVFGGWPAGLVAAWLLAIPTVNVTLYTTVSLGGYGEMLLIGNLILLVALRFGKSCDRSPDTGVGRPGLLLLIFGFLAGLGLWAFGLTLVYSLPAAVYVGWKLLTARDRRLLSRGLPGLAAGLAFGLVGFMTGSAPWWYYAARHGTVKLLGELAGGAISGVEGAAWPVMLGRHLLHLALFGGTVLTGLRPPWSTDWLGFPLLIFALAFWIAVMFSISSTLRWALFPLAAGNSGFTPGSGAGARQRLADAPAVPDHQATGRLAGRSLAAESSTISRDGILLLAAVGLTLAIGFVVTPFGADPSGRYFLPLAVIMALFAGLVITRLQGMWGRRALLLVGMVLVFNLWGTLQAAARFPPGFTTQFDAETRLDHRYDGALIAFLRQQGERLGYSTYWVSYPLAFLSQEELIFVPRLPYHSDLRYTARDNRYAPYADRVAAAERVAFITVRHENLERKLRAEFVRFGLTWQEQQIGDYRVFYHLSHKVTPGDLNLGLVFGDGVEP